MDTDQDRLSRLRAGELGALEECYRDHGAGVYRLCLQVLGQPADAEDATQEVFLKLFDRARQFRGRSRLATWLYRLTVNLCLHRLERERVRRAQPLSADERADAVDFGPSPLDQAAARDELERLRRLLARLSVSHRLVLHLREVEGLAYREISGALGLPLGTVMSRLARAREQLALLVGSEPRSRSPSPLTRSLP